VLDYVVITHYHGDHAGNAASSPIESIRHFVITVPICGAAAESGCALFVLSARARRDHTIVRNR